MHLSWVPVFLGLVTIMPSTLEAQENAAEKRNVGPVIRATAPVLLPPSSLEWGLFHSLFDNLKEVLFPRRYPRVVLTSRPAHVSAMWGQYNNYRKPGVMTSAVFHVLAIGAIIAGTLLGHQTKPAPRPRETITYIPSMEPPLPMAPAKREVAGGGGGGDRDKLQAPKGKLPKKSMEQFTPPQVVVRNEKPKLSVEPTVVVPPQVKIAEAQAPNLGNPAAADLPAAPPSNGTGSGGGIGSGSGGGVGPGTGPGVGPGRGGGIGGGVFRVGGGISAPRPLDTPDPEYTEEARRAKFQGTCILGLIVDAEGKPREIRVSRSVGLGLDQKAIDAVRQWRFEPAMKDGRPVAVQISVQVSFRLY
ncbi:MAG TPA: energy transducer TonB [Terriglobales bacterium]|nr:energy transducer TonB [Terriglobales bacterium]